MRAYQVLLGNLPVTEGKDPCPWGLLEPATYGEGVNIPRCQLKAGHKEPHRDVTSYPQEKQYFVRVTTLWEITKHLIPVIGCDGHASTAAERGSEESTQ
jgi:hypothetical protein